MRVKLSSNQQLYQWVIMYHFNMLSVYQSNNTEFSLGVQDLSIHRLLSPLTVSGMDSISKNEL